MRQRLTPHNEPHPTVEVAKREGADAADVSPLVGHLSAHDDQRRVHDGVAVLEAHTA